jgi:hypothetical protein
MPVTATPTREQFGPVRFQGKSPEQDTTNLHSKKDSRKK